MAQFREVLEGEQNQGVDENILWQLRTNVKDENDLYVNVTSVVSVKAYSIINGVRTDVSSTTLSGTPSYSGRVITLPAFGNNQIVVNTLYRLEVKYLVAGNTLEDFIMIRCRN